MTRILKTDTYLHIPQYSRFISENVLISEQASNKAAIFLDRDGVIVEHIPYLSKASQLRILQGVIEAIQALQEHFYIIVVTNQAGIARGFYTEVDLLNVHQELVQQLSIKGVFIDALYYCPHHPSAGKVKAYSIKCSCRKPAPGMLLRASHDWGIDLSNSVMVGDMSSDVQAGLAVGASSILLADSYQPDLSNLCISVTDLFQAAQIILKQTL